LEVSKRRARNIDPLSVRSGIRRGEMEARIVDHIIQERNIGRSQPFKNVSAAKGHAQPQALGPRTGKEGPPGKAFRVHRIVQVEVADVTDMLDVVEKKRDDPSRQVEKLNPPVADEGRERQVPGKCFASEAADDDLFVGGGHSAPGLSHGSDRSSEKGASPVVNTLMLCYTYVLCLRVKI
jgi:hypothetical protein